MFDLTKEVPSLELCKRLKEVGYPQDGGGWYWIKYAPLNVVSSPEDEYYIDPLVNPQPQPFGYSRCNRPMGNLNFFLSHIILSFLFVAIAQWGI